MESVRLDLNEGLARELEKAPMHIRARVDERQKDLLGLIRQYYSQKQRELEAFARDQLAETDDDTVSELDQSYSGPKLKSIVKRRPSSSDKRVSFINSPTHAPVTKSEASTDTEGTDDELVSPEDPANFDAPVGLTSEDPIEPRSRGGVAVSMPALDLSSLTKHEPKQRPRLLDDGTPYTGSADTGIRPVEADEETLGHEDLFSFETELNGDAASERPSVQSDRDEMAQSHHAPLDDPSPPRQSAREIQAPTPRRQQSQFQVGSAPISIHSSVRGLDGDGGPLPLTENEREEEASLSRPDDLASLPRNKIKELDPGSMSFSQRMEWETLRRRIGS